MIIIEIVESFRDYICPDYHQHNQPIIHQSPINSKVLLIIRTCCLIYLSGIYIWEIEASYSSLINIIYLTQWGYFFTWLYFFLVIQHYLLYESLLIPFNTRFARYQQKLKYGIELIYVFAFDSELPITIVFWGILFKIVLEADGVTAQIIALNANLHAGPLICLILQLPFNAFSFPDRYFIIVLVGGTVYLVINMVYSLLVSPIYRPINWVSVVSYLLCIGAIVLGYLMHWMGQLLYRKWKQQKLQKQNYSKMKQSRIQFESRNLVG